jgi:hypothetical protein
MFIFGEYPDTYVDLVFSSHREEFTIYHIQKEEAEDLMRVWQTQRDEMIEMYAKLKEKS